MGRIKLNNISTSILKEDILNSNIKEIYTKNIYTPLMNTTNEEIISLLNIIDNRIEALNNSLVKFNVFIDEYISDYKNINKYLETGRYNNIYSDPTLNIMSNKETLDEIRLDKFNIPNQTLNIDYDKNYKYGDNNNG